MQGLYVTHCYLIQVQLRLADVAFQFIPEQTQNPIVVLLKLFAAKPRSKTFHMDEPDRADALARGYKRIFFILVIFKTDTALDP